MPFTLDRARALVFECLQSHLAAPARPIAVGIVAVDRRVKEYADRDGIAVEWNAAQNTLSGMDSVNVRAALAELYGAGLIVWGNDATQPGPQNLQVTEFGTQCLEVGATDPANPGGYLAALLVRVPNLEAVSRAYVEEALECFRRGCYRASAVMLGGASEMTMIRLIASFHAALQDVQRRNTFENRAIKPLSIQRRFQFFRIQLAQVRPTLPAALDEDLELKLDGIFAMIRAARNAGGHPALGPVSREAAHGSLLLFPSYSERAYALTQHFGAHPIP